MIMIHSIVRIGNEVDKTEMTLECSETGRGGEGTSLPILRIAAKSPHGPTVSTINEFHDDFIFKFHLFCKKYFYFFIFRHLNHLEK